LTTSSGSRAIRVSPAPSNVNWYWRNARTTAQAAPHGASQLLKSGIRARAGQNRARLSPMPSRSMTRRIRASS
jgi:hypothetical protein